MEAARKAVLFDLDGTLIDTAQDLAAAANAALIGIGLTPIEPETVRGLVGFGAKRMLINGVEKSAGRTASDQEIEEGLAIFLNYYGDHIAEQSRPFEGAIELIEQLRAKGRAIAVCTNKREALAVKLIETLGITHLFDAIVGGDTASAPKPDPAPILLCLERCGAGKGVFIGDSDTDIRAANAAEMLCFVADFGYGPVTLLEKSHAGFSHYDELAAQIEAIFEG